MARTRLLLRDLLKKTLEIEYLYFRRPGDIGMKYPCAIYDLANASSFYADDKTYINKKRWSITVIDEDPDTEIPWRLLELPYCSFDRQYEVDGLNHFVFTLYY